MSHEASNWVLRQRSRSAATQCLLLVIANAADPEGVAFGWWSSRDHWWPYLMERTRLSRGTLFKLLNELEDLGYFTREEAKPKEGGKAQPVIRLHIKRDVIEPERPDEIESPRETEQAERTPSETPSQSPRETEKPEIESPTETETVAASPTGRLAESPRETARDVPLENPITPKSPLSARSNAGEEVNGFLLFWSEYPDHQAMNRKRALDAFTELTLSDQQLAIKTVAFYARDIAKLKRRPVSPANWLSERRFSEYGAGRQSSANSSVLQIVPEGSEPWQAWCNVAAVTFGGVPKIPHFWGAQGARGAWRPTLWPLGGEAWLVPLDRWVFIENGTAQHGRWCERINEMLSRSPIPVRLAQVRAARVIRATGSTEQNPMGLFAPLEWPPPKGKGSDPPKATSLATEEELDQFSKTG